MAIAGLKATRFKTQVVPMLASTQSSGRFAVVEPGIANSNRGMIYFPSLSVAISSLVTKNKSGTLLILDSSSR